MKYYETKYQHQQEREAQRDTRIIAGLFIIAYLLMCALWFTR